MLCGTLLEVWNPLKLKDNRDENVVTREAESSTGLRQLFTRLAPECSSVLRDKCPVIGLPFKERTRRLM